MPMRHQRVILNNHLRLKLKSMGHYLAKCLTHNHRKALRILWTITSNSWMTIIWSLYHKKTRQTTLKTCRFVSKSSRKTSKIGEKVSHRRSKVRRPTTIVRTIVKLTRDRERLTKRQQLLVWQTVCIQVRRCKVNVCWTQIHLWNGDTSPACQETWLRLITQIGSITTAVLLSYRKLPITSLERSQPPSECPIWVTSLFSKTRESTQVRLISTQILMSSKKPNWRTMVKIRSSLRFRRKTVSLWPLLCTRAGSTSQKRPLPLSRQRVVQWRNRSKCRAWLDTR